MKAAGIFFVLLASFLIPAGRIRQWERERRAARELLAFLSFAETEISCRARPADEMIALFWNGKEREALSLGEARRGVPDWGKAGDALSSYIASLSRATMESGVRLTGEYASAMKEEEARLSRKISEEKKLYLPLFPTVTALLLFLLF